MTERRSKAHYSCLFKYFPHACTCNPSCVGFSYLWGPEVEILLKKENFEKFRSPIIFDWGN